MSAMRAQADIRNWSTSYVTFLFPTREFAAQQGVQTCQTRQFFMTFIVEASTYRALGVVFWENAKYLEKEYSARGETVPRNNLTLPFYYLISHSAELFLKCALLKRGTSPADLKNFSLRHNLSNLLDDVENKGVPISGRTREIIMAISDQHKSHELRYTAFLDNGIAILTPEPSDIHQMLEELMLAGAISTHGV